jgi:hypothetical protein
LRRPDALAELGFENLRQILQQGLVAIPFLPGGLQFLQEGVVVNPVGVGRFRHRDGRRRAAEPLKTRNDR